MDRPIVYVGQIPLETDLLLTNKNTMLALGAFIQAVLGASVSVDGLACVPNSPAALNVKVGPGSIYSLQNVDGTAYGTVAADTVNQVVKQGLAVGTQTLGCPAPATTGQSIVYLVQAAYQDTDAGGTVLPYYNASNPAVAWSGPNNTGVSQNTVRKGVCLVGVKAGIAATTGTQATPAPDAGYTGLYAVTVANGQTTVTSGNIAQLAAAPFIATKLPAVLSTIQSGAANYAQDSSGAANTITVVLNPAPAALTNGMRINVKVANSSTGPTVINANGLGNVAAVTTSGAAFGSNTVVANGIFGFVYDANGNRWQLQGFTAASATGLIPANNLSDVSSAATALNNLLPSQTGNGGKSLFTNGANSSWQGNNVYQATPSDPAGTSDATGKMMGLGGAFTPNSSGNVLILVCGDFTSNGNVVGGSAQIRYGTGSAPANGGSLAGSTAGSKVRLTEVEAANDFHPVAMNAIVTGLTPGTLYWIDVALAVIGGGTAAIADISLSAAELR